MQLMGMITTFSILLCGCFSARAFKGYTRQNHLAVRSRLSMLDPDIRDLIGMAISPAIVIFFLNSVKTELRSELKADNSAMKSELKADIAALKSDNSAMKSELKADNFALKSELKADLMAIEFTMEKGELKASADLSLLSLEVKSMKSDVGNIHSKVDGLSKDFKRRHLSRGNSAKVATSSQEGSVTTEADKLGSESSNKSMA